MYLPAWVLQTSFTAVAAFSPMSIAAPVATADIIGIGGTLAYDLARTGDFPVRILCLGRRTVIRLTSVSTSAENVCAGGGLLSVCL
jgi:hypothetical protein